MSLKINHLYKIHAKGNDPRENLALEAYLLDCLHHGDVVVYLWQNANTVVIGRNQNVWKECNLKEMESDAVTLVRRNSGGGAVYHDLGNLCFTFLADDAIYDEALQADIIMDALNSFGIQANKSGRNDILVHDKKISGNAYYHRSGFSYHHGTLLVDTDMEKLSKYLHPNKTKLQAKGVDSVRSRVCNIKDLAPTITIHALEDALLQSSEKMYGLSFEAYPEIDQKKLNSYIQQFSDEQWIYKNKEGFQYELEKRFVWGEIRMEFHIVGKEIDHVSVWSDSMFPDWMDALERKMKYIPFTIQDIIACVTQLEEHPIKQDLIDWFNTVSL